MKTLYVITDTQLGEYDNEFCTSVVYASYDMDEAYAVYDNIGECKDPFYYEWNDQRKEKVPVNHSYKMHKYEDRSLEDFMYVYVAECVSYKVLPELKFKCLLPIEEANNLKISKMYDEKTKVLKYIYNITGKSFNDALLKAVDIMNEDEGQDTLEYT